MDEQQDVNKIDTFKVKPYPDLVESWIIFAMFISLSLALGTFGAIFSKILPSITFKSWITLFTYTSSFTFLFIFILFRVKINNQFFTIKWGDPTLTVLILLLLITPLLSIVIEPISMLIPMPDFFKEMLKGMVSPNFASFLTVAIAAPICEEVICRGIILEGLLKNKMKPSKAIMWSSLIFAVLHLNPWQGIPAFLIGCTMGWVYYKTRSVWNCIFIHFVNNGLSFLILLLIEDPMMSTKELIGNGYYIILYISSALLLAILIYILNNYFKRNEKRKAFNNECL